MPLSHQRDHLARSSAIQKKSEIMFCNIARYCLKHRYQAYEKLNTLCTVSIYTDHSTEELAKLDRQNRMSNCHVSTKISFFYRISVYLYAFFHKKHVINLFAI